MKHLWRKRAFLLEAVPESRDVISALLVPNSSGGDGSEKLKKPLCDSIVLSAKS